MAAHHGSRPRRRYPPINDISTDTADPPVFWDMPKPSVYPGGQTAALQRDAYPDLRPLTLALAPERAFDLASAIARDSGWQIVAEKPDEGRIEAVATTLFYGFKDEVAIPVEPAEGGAAMADSKVLEWSRVSGAGIAAQPRASRTARANSCSR